MRRECSRRVWPRQTPRRDCLCRTTSDRLPSISEQRDTRAIILEPRVTEIGFAWHQEANGKLWWVLTTGTTPDLPQGVI